MRRCLDPPPRSHLFERLCESATLASALQFAFVEATDEMKMRGR